ncbi:MAG: pectin degradation protein [Clostridia bacterium]|jgi:quercetin dioxygenase-like cupin family protein|nr:pectin degradation protein [Clostridia bacterium]
MFILDEKVIATHLENGVIRKIKGYIDELMVVELKWQKGMVGDIHTHPHCQCGYIIKGSFEANMNGEKQLLKAGDCFYAAQDVPHGLVCLEDDSLMIDIFTPMRGDFIK